jgi:glycosyltransferase involved in cell wall biosynthesis
VTTKKITVLYFNLFTWLGGGEYSVYNLAKNLDRSKFRPILLFCKRGPFTDKADADKIETFIVPFIVTNPVGILKPGNIIKNFRTSFEIMKLLRNQQVDVVQCSDVFSLLLLLPSLIRFRLPVVYSVIVFYGTLRYWLFNLLAILFIDRIVANSEAVKNDLLNNTVGLRAISSVAYNGVDSTLFYPRSNEEKTKIISKLRLPVDKKIIGLVGRYEVWKGHLTFINVVQRLLQVRDDICFLIVGGAITSEVAPMVARYRNEVISRINELKLQSSIIMWDHRDDIPEIMASLDICVCPSDYEPYGLVVLEAYESGVPVVASRTVGALDVLRGKPGIFIAEPKEPESFVREINKALDFDRAILNSRHNQNTSERVSWKKYANTFEELYEKVRRA